MTATVTSAERTAVPWQIELEMLRRLVAERAPLARFEGTCPSGLQRAEYRFKLMMGTSVYVQSPTTPTGMPRAKLGLWRFRLHRAAEPWRYTQDIDTVVEYIRECSQRHR